MKKPDKDDEILAVTRSGTVFRESVAEELAECERDGLDLFRVKRLYVGYPVLVPADGRGVPFPLSRTELDALRRRSEKTGQSFSDAIRAALKRRIDP